MVTIYFEGLIASVLCGVAIMPRNMAFEIHTVSVTRLAFMIASSQIDQRREVTHSMSLHTTAQEDESQDQEIRPGDFESKG
jgi:hypothetical protein